MTIRLTMTNESVSHIKCLVYGEAGTGKTWLCKTAPKPLIISAEKGLLTLKNEKIKVIEISSFKDLEDAYDFVLTDPRAAGIETVCLDSISDIAETVLGEEKENCGADPRQAYGAYQDKLLPLIKKFRDLEGKHVYFTAKLKRVVDDFAKVTYYGPSLPGQQLGNNLPYLFDLCMFLGVGEEEDGTQYRYLQTQSDVQHIAKDRSGKLDATEPPDLTHIFEKSLSDIEPDAEPEGEFAEGEGNAEEESAIIEVDGGFEDENEQVEGEEDQPEGEAEAEEVEGEPGDEPEDPQAAAEAAMMEED